MNPLERTNLYQSFKDYLADYFNEDQILGIVCEAFDEGLATWDETIDDIDPDEFQKFIERF